MNFLVFSIVLIASLAFADDANDLANFLGPANVAQIPSDVWTKITNGVDREQDLLNTNNPLWFLNPWEVLKIRFEILEKIFFWCHHHHRHQHGHKTRRPPPTKRTKQPKTTTTATIETTEAMNVTELATTLSEVTMLTTESSTTQDMTNTTGVDCSNCSPMLAVLNESAPINQTRNIDPNTGCNTIVFSCDNPNGGTVAFQYFYKEQDLGTSITNGKITRTVICNTSGQYWFVENGVMRFIDTINCIVA